jgi:hypothetical protein
MNDVNHFQPFMDGAIPQTLVITKYFLVVEEKKLDGNHFQSPINNVDHVCRNPRLGLATKAKGYKVMGQVGDPGALHMLPGVQRV